MTISSHVGSLAEKPTSKTYLLRASLAVPCHRKRPDPLGAQPGNLCIIIIYQFVAQLSDVPLVNTTEL
jgi:hypothetical protein